MKKNTINQK